MLRDFVVAMYIDVSEAAKAMGTSIKWVSLNRRSIGRQMVNGRGGVVLQLAANSPNVTVDNGTCASK